MTQRTCKGASSQPPVEHRFKPGHSGNPNGRPPKLPRSWSNREFHRDVMKELNEEVPVTLNGRRQRLSKYRLVIRHAVNLAIKGDIQAMKFVMQVASRAAHGLADAHPEAAKNLQSLENRAMPLDESLEWQAMSRRFLRIARLKSRQL